MYLFILINSNSAFIQMYYLFILVLFTIHYYLFIIYLFWLN